MPIYRLLQNSSFGPEEVAAMGIAFEAACEDLGLNKTREDQFTEIVASTIFELAQTGIKSANELHAQTVARLGPERRKVL